MSVINRELGSLLRELEAFGEDNDARVTERQFKMLNIERETGELLYFFVQLTNARCVLEVGTSNGYSTIWLAAAAAQNRGQVITLERLVHKLDMAKQNWKRAGLEDVIESHLSEAQEHIRTVSASYFDFIFLDGDRDMYVAMWPDLDRVLEPGGLVVVDNSVSHAGEVSEFRALVATTCYVTSLVPVGKGEFLIYKPR